MISLMLILDQSVFCSSLNKNVLHPGGIGHFIVGWVKSVAGVLQGRGDNTFQFQHAVPLQLFINPILTTVEK